MLADFVVTHAPGNRQADEVFAKAVVWWLQLLEEEGDVAAIGSAATGGDVGGDRADGVGQEGE